MKLKKILASFGLALTLMVPHLALADAELTLEFTFDTIRDDVTIAKLNAKTPEDIDLVQKVSSLVRRMTVKFPPNGMDFNSCNQNPLMNAYVTPASMQNSELYVCRILLSEDLSYISQTLVHEALHMAYQSTDECKTTEREIRFMKLAEQQPYANGYVKRCGLTTR